MTSVQRLGLVAVLAGVAPFADAKTIELLNASYDPTRELYAAINKAFAADWKARTGDVVVIDQSHDGSAAQARAVIDGEPADVVTLGLAADIDAIADKGLLSSDWQKRLPNNAAPYTSTVVFVVRKGNPRGIKDWPDLIAPGVQVVTPNPKTSSGARWAYFAAWLYARHQTGATEDAARDYMKALYQHVPILDTGARASALSFTLHGIGDVLLAWESEAYLLRGEAEPGGYEIVYPSSSILALPPVAMVDKNADRHGTRPIAEAYLTFLFGKEAQEIDAAQHYRPTDPEVAAAHGKDFPAITVYSLDDEPGGWPAAEAAHFADGGIFDQVTAK